MTTQHPKQRSDRTEVGRPPELRDFARHAVLVTVIEDRNEWGGVKWTVRNGRRVVTRVHGNVEVLVMSIAGWFGVESDSVTFMWRDSDQGRTVPRLVSVVRAGKA